MNCTCWKTPILVHFRLPATTKLGTAITTFKITRMVKVNLDVRCYHAWNCLL